jgi:hypothetical protein
VKNADRRAWRHGARGTGEAHIVRSGQEPRPDTSRMLNSRIPTEVPTAVKVLRAPELRPVASLVVLRGTDATTRLASHFSINDAEGLQHAK